MTRSARPMPPPLVLPPNGLWRTTPPAIFAPILGLFGLGIVLRALAVPLGVEPLGQLAEALLGAVVLLHAFALLAYAGKVVRRPGALIQDLSTLPGKSGVAAGVAAIHLSAAALVPLAPALALGVTLTGLALQALLAGLIVRLMLTGPPEGRRISPVLHLVFVGHVLAPLALIPLGWTGLAQGLLVLGAFAAVPILLGGARQAGATPPPLRPTLAIHLAPASVIASGAALAGWPGVALALALVAAGIAGVLAVRLRWVLAAGFSPFWGALTFPLAAFAQAALRGLGTPGLWLATGVAALACGVIPWIAWRILKDWPGGALARKTNAAVA
jgi:tellurite resistance protein